MKKSSISKNTSNGLGNSSEFLSMEERTRVFNDDLEYEDFDDIYDYEDIYRHSQPVKNTSAEYIQQCTPFIFVLMKN